MKDEELQFDCTCYVKSGLCCYGVASCTASVKLNCSDDRKFDYTICDRYEYVKEHPEYVDEAGFRRKT